MSENFKALTTYVPGWANWCATDSNGEIYIYEHRPEICNASGLWKNVSGGLMSIGKGPKPKNWKKEIYRLVPE